jgi:hypothetical protein
MTSYIIRSSPSLGTPNVYGWSEGGTDQMPYPHVRCDRLTEYATALAAAWALAGLPDHLVHFYRLEVAATPCPPSWRGNGWMVGHSGYDLH